MRLAIIVAVLGLLIYSAPEVLAQEASGKVPDEIELSIRQFWDGLGSYDTNKIKQSVDWPFMIVEASAARAKTPAVVRNPLDLDQEFAKSAPDAARRKNKSEFFGTKLASFRVELLNPNLASVSYTYELPQDIAETNPKGSVSGNALAVLRRDPERDNKWRIVFITIAQ